MKAARILAAMAVVLFAGRAAALGLGSIQAHSYLNQPFSATIPLIVDSSDELDGLRVGLADADAFKRAGIPFDDSLVSLQFKLITNQGAPYVRVTSGRIIRAPFLNFLVQVSWSGGKLLREYTVLLDPAPAAPAPGEATATPAEVVSSPAPAVHSTAPPVPVASVPQRTHRPSKPASAGHPSKRAAPRPSPAAAKPAAAAGRYGPVKPQETLWSIASRVRPDPSITVDQALLALFRANPRDFDHGRIDGLMKGVTLRIPSAEQMRAVDPQQAHRQVQQLLRAAAATPASAGSASVGSQAPVKPAPVAGATSTPATSASKRHTTAPAVSPAAVGSAPTTAANEASAAPPSSAAPAPSSRAPAASATAPAVVSSTAVSPAGPVSARPAQPKTAASPQPQPIAPKTRPRAISSGPPVWQLPLLGLLVLLALAWLFYRRRSAGGKVPAAEPTTGPGRREMPSLTRIEPSPVVSTGGGEAQPATTDQIATEPAVELAELPERPTHAADRAEFEAATAEPGHRVELGVTAGDAEADADFHLAYGLYDEAINLLRKAIAERPDRLNLKRKLAEAYFAADKPVEFVELAEELQGQLADEDWAAIVAMGRRLQPEHPLFGGQGQPRAAQDQASTSATPTDRETPGDQVIEFDPGALSESLPEPADQSQPPAGEDTLDLREFDAEPATAAPKPAATDETRLEFSLQDFDSPSRESEPTAAPADGDEENATKLDLARAYADMGDNEAARGLLEEVVRAGSAAQRKEAEALIRRLLG